MADGPTLSDSDVFGGADIAPGVANPTPVAGGMSYDPDYGIVRGPDGSIKAINKLYGADIPGNPYRPATAPEIASFQQAFPEDIGNKGTGTRGGPGAGGGPATPPGQLSDKDVFPDYTAQPPIAPSPALQAAQADAAKRQIDTPAGAFANGVMFGFQPDLLAGGTYIETAIGNALDRLKGQTPKYSASDAAAAEEQAVRSAQGDYAKAHPIANAAAGVAGGFANPATYAGGEFLAGAPTALGMIGRGAQLGAATGALQGFGEAGGNLGQRFTGTLEGGTIGAITGGAGAGVGAAISGFGRSAATTAAWAEADAALSRTGIDPSSLPSRTVGAIDDYLRQGRDPVDSAFAGVADTLPTKTPMSVGQMSGDPALQLTENQALMGGSGTAATIAAKGFREGQEGAFRENLGNIGTTLAGAPTQSGEGGVRLSGVLNAKRDQMAAGVDKAYDAAREATGATLPAEHAADVVRNVRHGLQDYDPRNIPKVTREIKNLDDALNARPSAGPTRALPKEEAKPGVPVRGIPVTEADLSAYSPKVRAAIAKATGAKQATPDADVRAIFDARARLTKLTQDSDRVSAGAARRAVHQLDQAIDDAVSQDLFRGDKRAVALWKDAIGKRRALGKLFEGDDLIDKLTERVERGGEHNQLRVDPVDATNYILGRQGLVGLGRANTVRDIARLGNVLGHDSAAWKGLKGEVFDRLARSGEGRSVGGAPTFSGAKFAANWRDAQANYGPVIDQMFTKQEKNLINRFAVIADRITNPVPGGYNASNSAIGIKSIVKGMRRLPFIGLKSVPFIDHLADSLEAANNARVIKAATVGAKPRYVSTPSGAVAQTIGYGASNQAQRSALEGVHQ